MSFNSVISSDKIPAKKVKKKRHDRTGFLVDYIMGGVGAAISKTAVAPIERIKLLMQYQDEMIKAGRLDRPYTGIIDCFSRIIRQQGASTLWKGNLVGVTHYYPTQAFNFALKDFFRQLVGMDEKRNDNLKWFLGNLASGGAAGAVSLTLVYSLDYARTRLNASIGSAEKNKPRQFNSLVDVYRKTIATDGITGLYRGFFIPCVGIVVYRGLYFGMFDSLKPVILSGPLTNNFFANFMLGWGVTIVASFASHPFDIIRRGMTVTSGETVKYKSSMDCVVEIVKKEGVKSLFKGAGDNILRAVAGGGMLAVYDQLHLIFYKYVDGE